MIQTIGLAVAFSPTAERMLAEAANIARHFNARLVLIHIGEHGQKEDVLMQGLLESRKLSKDDVTIRWEKGDPARTILKACDREKVDLLIAGALKKENLFQYYLGTIARHIMRRSKCSVLLLTQPSLEPEGFKNVVVDADERPRVEDSLSLACKIGKNGSWIHVVRELKMFGLAMSAADQSSEDEYEKIRQGLIKDEVEKVEKLLQKIPHDNFKINIKIITGKSGFELAQFAKRKQADLLVVGAPPRRFKFLDRVFTHDLEYVFADLPCSLLIVQPGKGDGRG
ncbi:MAG: universal stress protein [Cyclobacteriaceae bacterium]|nr:universal stress protein [Cyclobacteriaceae bacterium]